MNATIENQDAISPDYIHMIGAAPSVRKDEIVQVVAEEPTSSAVVEEENVNVAKNVALFFAAPFIGLAYVVALPFIGVGMLASALVEA